MTLTCPRHALLFACLVLPAIAHAASPLTLVVMDPLSLPLSCACVDGVGQRRYESFATELSKQLDREIELIYEESLQLAIRRTSRPIDLVIGKRSTVLLDANSTDQAFQSVASLSDRGGSLTVCGTVLARTDSSLTTLRESKGKTIAIGPPEHDECHSAAKLLLAEFEPHQLKEHDSIESAVYAFDDGDVNAVVVSDFLPPLLVGCGKLDQESFKIVGQTPPTPFVQAFVSLAIDAGTRNKIAAAIVHASADPAIRDSIESKGGFVANSWTDWRGANRDGQSESLPAVLPNEPEALWRFTMTGPAMAGISATENVVIVADKNGEATEDIFRALDAATGQLLWTLRYPSEGKMDYTNAPRATPVMVGNLVILQGAFGVLTCATVDRGEIVWQKDLVADYGGELPSWGYCVPPLVVDDKVIIAPGGKQHSVLALSLQNGQTLWSTAGHAAAYSPMIHTTFGGRHQVVGYDSASLSAWDLHTGQRKWQLVPPDNTDFHVGTPVPIGKSLLVSTENNATRVYAFDQNGAIVAEPTQINEDCAPDTCTPVVAGDRVFCSAYGELFCLDASKGYATVWRQTDDRFYDHTNLIAGNDRLLLWSSSCDLMLIDTTADDFTLVSSLRPMQDPNAESMSHPAIVGDRIYLRSQNELICLKLR